MKKPVPNSSATSVSIRLWRSERFRQPILVRPMPQAKRCFWEAHSAGLPSTRGLPNSLAFDAHATRSPARSNRSRRCALPCPFSRLANCALTHEII